MIDWSIYICACVCMYIYKCRERESETQRDSKAFLLLQTSNHELSITIAMLNKI